jgi:hypothetical protein
VAKVRIFISFDYDNDDDLRLLLLGQAKHPHSPFEITDWSLKNPLPGDWKTKIVPRIRAASQMAVICGHYTDTASGVSAEVKIAREEGIPYFLLAGRASGVNKKPKSILSTDKMYRWTWENLEILVGGGR